MPENPFQRTWGSDEESIDLLGAKSDGGEFASMWLLHSAIADLNSRLKAFGVSQRVSKTQGGKRYIAIGADLPKLKADVNDALHAQGRPPMDRVTFSIGLTLLNDRDFKLGESGAVGFYSGVRVQRLSPDGTVEQSMHDRIYDSCIGRLSKTGQAGWERRRTGEYWPIWRYCDSGRLGERTPPELKEQILVEFLEGLAALQGLCW